MLRAGYGKAPHPVNQSPKLCEIERLTIMLGAASIFPRRRSEEVRKGLELVARLLLERVADRHVSPAQNGHSEARVSHG